MFGQRFASDGNRSGAEFQVNSFTTGPQRSAASAAVGTAGDFVITWQGLNQDGDGYGVFGQRFASDGSRTGAEFRITSFTTSDQQYATVAGVSTAGDFVVAWESLGQDGSGYGVFGQRFGAATVLITAPGAAKENWGVGSVQRVRAEHDLGSGATFDVTISHDGGATFPTTAGTGAVGNSVAVNQLWTVTDNGGSPALPQSARVRVTSVTPWAGVEDDSGAFEIQAPLLTVNRPRNNVNAGEAFKIVWTHNLGYRRPFRVELSRDGGASYAGVIAASTLSQWAWRGEAYWAPTGTCSPHCRVRVTSLDQPGVFGVGPAFQVVSPPEFESTLTPGASIGMVGAPGESTSIARFTVSNSGGSDLTVAAGALPAPYLVHPTGTQTIPAAGSVEFRVSCGAVYPGDPPGTTLTLTTNDADEGTVTYSLVCSSGAPGTIGCYRDQAFPLRDLNGLSVALILDPPGIEACRVACSSFGFAYAGMQAGNQCYCGDSYGLYGTCDAVNPDGCDCTIPCPDGALRCGGASANYIVQTGVLP